MTDFELTNELSMAVYALGAATANKFFAKEGSVWFGNPDKTDNFATRPAFIVRAEGAPLLADNLNKVISGARSSAISNAEDRVRKAKQKVAATV